MPDDPRPADAREISKRRTGGAFWQRHYIISNGGASS
jgi:hypothetical protein